MKVIKNVLIIISLLLIILTLMQVTSLGAFKDDLSKIEAQTVKGTAVTSTRNVVGIIIQIVKIVATGTAIIMLTVLAIKYMVAAPGDKADIKKHAIVYVVGAIVLFATTGILTIIENFSKNIA